MWSSRPLVRNALIALSLLGAMTLAGCSGFTPVYGERALGTERHAFRYADPDNRLEQIIYQELVLRLGQTADPASPVVRIATTSFSRDLTQSNTRTPNEQSEAVVTAAIEVLGPDGAVVLQVTRSAASVYTTDNQALASAEAERQAYEQAARELAETVRLTLLGALSQPAA